MRGRSGKAVMLLIHRASRAKTIPPPICILRRWRKKSGEASPCDSSGDICGAGFT